MMFKLGDINGGEFFYSNIYGLEVYPHWSRVTIAPSENQVSLMLDIAEAWNGPYMILYVLNISHCGHEHARYQSPEPCGFDEVVSFMSKFGLYFEKDSRHNLWLKNLSGPEQLIYDNHNLIYSYGSDDKVISLLDSKHFTCEQPQIPSPHTHNFNHQFNDTEDEIIKYYDWVKYPLQDIDDL